MTGLVRKASILVLLGILLSAASALAGIPDPAHCTVPTFLDLFACKSGLYDTLSVTGTAITYTGQVPPLGNAHVVIRDVAGNPVAGCPVTFTWNTPDYKLYSPYPDVRGVVTCDNQLTAFSGQDGEVHVAILGAGKNTAPGYPAGNWLAAGPNYPLHITACGIEITPATGIGSAAYDENGVTGLKGVEATDVGGWVKDFGRLDGKYARSDFNHDGVLSSTDLARLVKVFGLGNSGASCGTLCP